jgi:nucleotide-binding universal stress UspA family protein
MSEHTLVPLDDSPLSDRALTYALDHHEGGTITLLHVLDFVDAGYAAPMESSLPGYWEEWYENATREADALFEAARETAEPYDVTVETEAVVGQPGRSIVEFAEENDVEHIVMGSHGRSGLSRLVLGSVAENVLRRASCPVTIVR